MKWIVRYIFSLLPLGLIGGGILLSEWLYKTFNCTTTGKEFDRCLAFGFDIEPVVVIGMFWFKYLLPVAWIISFPWFFYLVICHLEVILKSRRRY